MGLYPRRESALGRVLQGDPADPQNPQQIQPGLSGDHQGGPPGPYARLHDESPPPAPVQVAVPTDKYPETALSGWASNN